MPLTRVYLSVGEERARTRSLGQIWSTFSWMTWPASFLTRRLNSLPRGDGTKFFKKLKILRLGHI